MNYNPSMDFGVYIHIPYCLQKCHYCDFVTFELGKQISPNDYCSLLKKEIKSRSQAVPYKNINTIYFGGGTPSLLPAQDIVSIIDSLDNAGFSISKNTEITIEINPATITKEKVETYIKGGINRFSVGAQSFNDKHLTACGRKHSADDTRETLRLLNENDLNYSFDLLFALPGQSLEELNQDLIETISFSPPHLSAYCLTVPEGHPMSYGRPVEDEQVSMFKLIEQSLDVIYLKKYEISNFSKPGFESKHNMIYWDDSSYWGLGIGAHSYFASKTKKSSFGFRFWNPSNIKTYKNQVEDSLAFLDFDQLPKLQFESLMHHQSLTDYCHTFLRTSSGFSLEALRYKFGNASTSIAKSRLEDLLKRGWVIDQNNHWKLTKEGELLSNQVFSELTFLKGVIPS